MHVNDEACSSSHTLVEVQMSCALLGKQADKPLELGQLAHWLCVGPQVVVIWNPVP